MADMADKEATDKGVAEMTEADNRKTSGGVDPAALAEAIRYEHSLTFREAVKLYPAAIAWSAFVSIGVIMLAFDPQLLGNFFAMPQFTKDFGYLHDEDVSLTQSTNFSAYMANIGFSISSVCRASSVLLVTSRLTQDRRPLAIWPINGQPHRPSCWRPGCRLSDGLLWSQAHLWCVRDSNGLFGLYPVLCTVP